MYTIHIYDFKAKKKFNTPLNDPFNVLTVIGRYEVYNEAGEFMFSSGKRRVKGLVDYTNFLPLNILRIKQNNSNLMVHDIALAARDKRLAPEHKIITVR